MRIRPFAGAVAAALLALTAACGSGTPAPDGPSPQAVAWVDKVCGAMKAVQDAGSTQPNADATNPAAAIGGLETYFGGVVTAVGNAQATLKAAGPSPVAGADADVTRISGELGQVQAAFQKAHDAVKGLDPANPNAVATGLTTALAPVQQLNVASDPIGQMRRNPAFDTVARGVPSCSAA
jgi:hypothetical protein